MGISDVATGVPSYLLLNLDQMQKITTFLTYNNQAEEAANLYTSIFKNSEITMVNRQGEDGPVFIVGFQIEGQNFLALNGGPSFSFEQGISLLVNCADQEEVDHLWEKLSEGGEQQPCGWLKDKFGVSWQIIPTVLGELMQSTDGDKGMRVMQAMLQMTKIDIKTLQEV
jgi:predicted 3-demethylubiquinone-9 3-methyltransferase (glyoxalase superfamily)